jgi:hypothetical protein
MTPPMKSKFPLLARRFDRTLPESYSVKAPETTPIVCMMFTEHPITTKKRKEFQDDKDGKDDALAMRTQFFSPNGFLASKGAARLACCGRKSKWKLWG